MIVKKNVQLLTPSVDDRRAYDQRLQAAIGLGPIKIPLSVMKRVSPLIQRNSPFPCIIGMIGDHTWLIDVGVERSYSIALDLGTTNLVALLYDNVEQKDVFIRSLENPQVHFGSDILTRMHHTMSHSTADVYQALTDGINNLTTMLCQEAGIELHDVHAMTIAGNTVMTHFFLGLDISTIPIAPFVPMVRIPGFFTAAELSLSVNPEALVYVFPNAGSYVGGDITSGIVASGMSLVEGTSILIDVGTNAEIVIGNKDWLIVGAGAAGPALEEGISRIGRRARKGIIYDVEIMDGRIICKTFDQGTPEGICGSGMVSLLYELYREGIIDKSGIFIDGEHIMTVESEKAFSVSCGSCDSLYITQAEIQNFMKSKAAMFTLLLVLTRSVGISFSDITKVYVSGALGTGINPAKAIGIGMLPAWPAEIVQLLGNSSLEGARMLLIDGGLVNTINAIVEKITYKHMYDDPEFMREFLGAVFIPHTNPDLLNIS